LCASDLLSAIISGCEFLLRHICKSQLQQSLRTGRSGDWIPVETRFSAPAQTRPTKHIQWVPSISWG